MDRSLGAPTSKGGARQTMQGDGDWGHREIGRGQRQTSQKPKESGGEARYTLRKVHGSSVGAFAKAIPVEWRRWKPEYPEM